MTNDGSACSTDQWYAGDIEYDGSDSNSINLSDCKCNKNNGFIYNRELHCECTKRICRANRPTTPECAKHCALSDSEVSLCGNDNSLDSLIKDDVFMCDLSDDDSSKLYNDIRNTSKQFYEDGLNTPELSDDDEEVRVNGTLKQTDLYEYTPLGFTSNCFDGSPWCSKCGSSESKQCKKLTERSGSIYNGCYWRVILEPDKDGDNLIFMAILFDMTDLCNKLLALIPQQAFIQIKRNNMFQTALHLAALTENTKLTRRVLVAGVQLDSQDKYGNTALHIACKKKNIAVAKALLEPVTPVEEEQNTYRITYPEVPQNLEIRNYAGETCFIIAAMNGDISMMDLLLSNGADINVKDIKSGMTCLHLLTELGRIDTIKYFLDKITVDINAKTYSWFTPLDIANLRGQSKIAYLLLCAGAKPKLRPRNCEDFFAESDSEESDY